MPFKPSDKNYGVERHGKRFGARGSDYGIGQPEPLEPSRSDFGLSSGPPTLEDFGLTQDLVSAWNVVKKYPEAPSPPNASGELAKLFLRLFLALVIPGVVAALAAFVGHPIVCFFILIAGVPLLLCWALDSQLNTTNEHQRRLLEAHETVRGLHPGFEDQLRLFEKARVVHRNNLKAYEHEMAEFSEAQNRAARLKERWWMSLSGLEFESELGRLFLASGYTVEQTPISGDGGVDLILTKGREKTVVQCKAHKRPVGIGPARELAAARSDVNADRAILAALGGVTGPVKEYIRDKPIEVIALAEVLEMARGNSA